MLCTCAARTFPPNPASRSINNTFAPERAAATAAETPAGPPPATTTSNLCFLFKSRLSRFSCLNRSEHGPPKADLHADFPRNDPNGQSMFCCPRSLCRFRFVETVLRPSFRHLPWSETVFQSAIWHPKNRCGYGTKETQWIVPAVSRDAFRPRHVRSALFRI